MAALIQINDEENSKYRPVGRGQDRALKGTTLRLKTSRAFAVRAARLFDDQNSVAAENGADQSDQAESQQDPMQPLDEPEGRFRPSLGAGEQPSIEEQRLGNEEHQGEQQPHCYHRVHPPVFHREKTVPQIEPNDHVKTGEPGKRRRNARLIAKPPLGGLEEDNAFRRGLEISHRRQKYRRHEGHAADPEDDGENVKSSGERYVIHRAESYASNHREVQLAQIGPTIRGRGFPFPLWSGSSRADGRLRVRSGGTTRIGA
jgi:hypothetical protein